MTSSPDDRRANGGEPNEFSRRAVPVILGTRSLPPGFDHPHASDEARQIAEQGTILRAQVGSGVHGTSISGEDDRDEMGLCLEPADYVTGLAQVPAGVGANTFVDFEQYQPGWQSHRLAPAVRPRLRGRLPH